MKIKDLEIPDDLLYTKEHEWARLRADGTAIIGITDYAAKTLNDIVYVSLPAIGQALKQFATFGTVESIKAVSELYSPLSGTVTKVNEGLTSHPELTNQSPYEDGWLMEINPTDVETEKRNLLTPAEYAKNLAASQNPQKPY